MLCQNEDYTKATAVEIRHQISEFFRSVYSLSIHHHSAFYLFILVI